MNTNIEERLRTHVEEVGVSMLHAMVPNVVTEAKSEKQQFAWSIAKEEKASLSCGESSEIMFDLSVIDFKFVRAWANRHYKAQESKKGDVEELYKKAFMKEYYEEIKKLSYMVIHQDDLSFRVLNDNEVTVLHPYPRDSEITRLEIPAYVQGYRVTEIAAKAFNECENLSQVTLPPTLKRIQHQAFDGCRNLKIINLPEGVEIIGKGAFCCCNALDGLVLPTTLKAIPEGMCYECGISSIVIPEGVTEIPTGAFYDCANLRRIVLPSTLQKIAADAFWYCLNLSYVIAPPTIDHIVMFDGGEKWDLKISHGNSF